MAGEVSYTLTGQPVISGGTRKRVTPAMVEFAPQFCHPLRPKPMEKGKCYFCMDGQLPQKYKDGEVLALYRESQRIEELGEHDFAVVKNTGTPHFYHDLVVPRYDQPTWPWKEEKAYSSDWQGARGVDYLVGLLTVCAEWQKVVWGIKGVTRCQIGFHHGKLGGQNITHPHWHLIGDQVPPVELCPWCEWRSKRDFVFVETESLVAFLDGTRAGETVICDRVRGRNALLERPEEVAGVLMKITTLFKERFRDPDFGLTTTLVPGGHFWLCYVPILNTQGCTEILGTRGLYSYTHPCAPEEMLRYLQIGKEYFPEEQRALLFPEE